MSSHKIQFQPGMSIPEFLRHFGTEAQCAEAMKRARWPRASAARAVTTRGTTSSARGRGSCSSASAAAIRLR